MFVEPEKPTWTDRFLYPVKFFLVIIGVLALCTVVTALGAVIVPMGLMKMALMI